MPIVSTAAAIIVMYDVSDPASLYYDEGNRYSAEHILKEYLKLEKMPVVETKYERNEEEEEKYDDNGGGNADDDDDEDDDE